MKGVDFNIQPLINFGEPVNWIDINSTETHFVACGKSAIILY